MFLTVEQLEAQLPDATQLLSDEPEMESSLHYLQLLLLVTSLEWLWRDRNDYFIGANLTIYYSRQQLRNRDFRGPDFFLVQPTEKHPRKSWVVWEEDGKYPNLIIELLSDSTARVDRTLKKKLYQNQFRTPEYFWFSPDTLEFQGFRLVGQQYQEIVPSEKGWRWSEVLNLYLGIAEGKLRYFTSDGIIVPTPEEAAIQIQQQAQQELEQTQQQVQQAQQELEQTQQQVQQAQQRAEQVEFQLEREQIRAERLAAQLRALGVEPEQET